jgi:hypothetical protein
MGLEFHWGASPSLIPEVSGHDVPSPWCSPETDQPAQVGLADVHNLAIEWLAAKRAKDWETADRLRRRLRRAGIDLDSIESYLSGGLVTLPSISR